MKVLIKSQQRLIKINQSKIKSDSKKILQLLGIKDAELSILLVNDNKMGELNFKYRGVDKTTDVLSFPQNPPLSPFTKEGSGGITIHAPILGDIVINLQAAKRQTTEHGLSFMDELRWLLVHGILHLIGYDHEKNKYAERKMREKEKELLKYLWRKDKNACKANNPMP